MTGRDVRCMWEGSGRWRALRPDLLRAVEDEGDAGQDIAAQDAMLGIDDQVATAVGFVQEDHVEVYGFGDAGRAIEAEQLIMLIRERLDTQALERVLWEKRGIGASINEQGDVGEKRAGGDFSKGHVNDGRRRIVVEAVIVWHRGGAPEPVSGNQLLAGGWQGGGCGFGREGLRRE